MTKNELFVELACPDTNGVSRWVGIEEFVGKYKSLIFGNGADWARRDKPLAKKYIIELDTGITKGNRVDRIRLNGFNTETSFNQNIRMDIKEFHKQYNCVMLGINSTSANTIIEIDHKDGRKDNETVSNLATQRIEDFQPLCKAANTIKRQICKACKKTNKRWDAKNIKGNPYSFYEGDEDYDCELGCKGCYQYDPVEYRKVCAKRISNEAAEYISRKLFGDEE